MSTTTDAPQTIDGDDLRDALGAGYDPVVAGSTILAELIREQEARGDAEPGFIVPGTARVV